MSVHVFSRQISELVDPEGEAERLATGFLFTEGALWDWRRECLLFSDLAGDVMRSWSEHRGIVEVRKPSGKSNGLTWDIQGRLVACEHVGRRVTRTEADGSIIVLASEWDGKPLNSPNDVVVKSDGAIYFSDPPYGLAEFYGIPRPQDLPFQGLYRISDDGELSLLVDDLVSPNGLCFTPDESRLYVANTERMQVRVFDVRPDGTLANSQVFFDYRTRPPEWAGVPDGMKLDERGNLYVTGPGGIWIITPQGEPLGVIRLPEGASNLNWGGTDWRTLYITATTSIYRIPMRVGGNKVPYMTRGEIGQVSC